MVSRDEEFLRRLRATFRLEAEDHLQAITNGLVDLEKSPAPDTGQRLLEAVFRAAHSLKGAARAVDLTDVEMRCQALEDLFASWQRGERRLGPDDFDSVHRTLDAIARSLGSMDAAVDTPPDAPAAAVGAPSAPPLSPPSVAERLVSAEDTIRVSATKLEAHVVEAEEMLTTKLTAATRNQELGTLRASVSLWRRQHAALQTDTRVMSKGAPATDAGLRRVLAYLEWEAEQLKTLDQRVAAMSRSAAQDEHVIARLVDDLLGESKKLLLLPFGSVTRPFAKLVRDLCRDQGKEADLAVRGEDVEIDKRVLEAMKAPLIHLLRNAIDHGLEMPDERMRAGKPARGTIVVAASRTEGGKVQIVVTDDGAGIHLQPIRDAAVARGTLTAAEARALTDAEARRLIFEPQVSTSAEVTRLSGRGLGLAIARENAERLGGFAAVESEPGRGSTFSLVVPAMLATFRGILVEAAQQCYVLPTLQVERVMRVRRDDIRTIEGRETISSGGRAIPLVRLAAVLEAEETASSQHEGELFALVLGTGDQGVAFIVHRVLNEQEILVKPLRKPLKRVRNVAGLTLLGSGRMAPILNVADLLRAARKPRTAAPVATPSPAASAAPKTILVAEDSITSRMLIKGILESAGYRVRTAVDGVEALTIVRAEPIDGVVSDVEMPRMNGFELTARLRADQRFAQLPVVLVTALETREHRERGMDVGANAYIVKSHFDQSNLLDAVRRLVG